MNNINKHVVILKNDAVGDLVHSLNAINNIVNDNNNLKITIFLSKLSEKFSFLIKNPKIEIRILNYDLSFNEKIKIFHFLSANRIEKYEFFKYLGKYDKINYNKISKNILEISKDLVLLNYMKKKSFIIDNKGKKRVAKKIFEIINCKEK